MELFDSGDCKIAVAKSGAGTPLVLVHGTGYDHTVWEALLPLLEKEHTVYALDRRGRSESSDGAEYSLQAEIGDVVAVCDAIGEPVALLGHGFGGLLAMEAALQSHNVSKLLVYEPWIIGSRVLPFRSIERLEALSERADKEGLLLQYTREIERLLPDEQEKQRVTPLWQARLATVETVIREMKALASYRFDAVPYRKMKQPALLLLGEKSTSSGGRQVWIAHEALPVSPIKTMAGQRHLAMLTAPDVLAEEINGFLSR